MRLATILAGSAIASLAVFTDVGSSVGLAPIARAEAADVSISVFYDGLSDHGNWVRHRDNYVFIPANVRRGWKPYTDGRWVYVEGSGWTWASNEPFGWATYHYGRWGYDDNVGWFWLPGTRWAPAWVSWRRGGDHVAWAPLPPRWDRRRDDVNISISVGDVPDYSWVAVPTRNFLDADLRVRIVDSDRDRRRIIQRTDFLGTPRLRDRIVVNTVIDINIIEKETGRKVRRIKARETDNPREARASGDQVTVFRGELRDEADAKPRRVRDAAEVRKVRRERNEDAADDAATDRAATGDDEDARKRRNADRNAGDDAANGAADNANADNANKRKRRNADQAAEQGEKKADDTASQNNRRKKPAAADGSDDNDVTTGSTEPAQQQSDRKKRRVQQKSNENAQQRSANDDRAQGEKKRPRANDRQSGRKDRNNKQCDPETNANC